MNQLRLILIIVFITCSSNVFAQIVYTTKTGEKYHQSSCRYLKYSKIKITIDKAIDLGYSPCSLCKPTKANTKARLNSKANAITPKTQSNTATKKTVATQCTAKTQKGKPCKRKTKNANGRCYQH